MSDGQRNALILAVCAAAWIIIFMRSATGEPERRDPTISPAEVQSFAKEKLNELQQQSFAQGKEFCALIYEDSSGVLQITPALAGSGHSCATMYVIEHDMLPLANLHTHGQYDTNFIGEAPSAQDLAVSAAERVDGYVSTPGGRFWFVDWETETTEQICGEGCLYQDPNYEKCAAFQPAQTYTLLQLRAPLPSETLPSLC
ncbi:MAG: DUF4329 domain-containing protein [Pseudomonadota bacterium]